MTVSRTATMQITRRIEFDAGHRIPDHESKCKNAHGHRYVLEATVTGPLKQQRGKSDDGMIVDFGSLKDLMVSAIGAKWDHAFLVADSDVEMCAALDYLGREHKHVVLPFVPTVENLARYAYDELASTIAEMYGEEAKLAHVRLYETPNCWADVYGPV